ncbi:hypothetical protein M2103_000946 [Ereboglobus sp. PH5-5]|uniref:hypothetical protein n=1 Tax=Ereboglobus sp. PH5-5 TaxID=2940529 RepID=UPI002405BF36|nr:hypothetical protein [Ereboglobus sp. PH5-5]MDF9832732.1 hypothetical protein [Ereboglobus sp. PH5-5]
MSKKAYAEFKKIFDASVKYNNESHRLAEAVTKDYEAMIVAYLAFFNTTGDVADEIKKASDALKAKDPAGWKTGEKVFTDLQNNSNFRDIALLSTTGGMLTPREVAEARVRKLYAYVFEVKKWYDNKTSGKADMKATDLKEFKAAHAHFKHCKPIIGSILEIKSTDKNVVAFVKSTGILWKNAESGSGQAKAAEALVASIKKEIGRAGKLKPNALPTGYLATLKALLPECVKLPGLIADAYKAKDGLESTAKGAQAAYDQLGKVILASMAKMSALLKAMGKPKWNIQGFARNFDDFRKSSSAEMLKMMRDLESDWVTDKRSFETLRKRFSSGGAFNLALESKLHENPKDSPLRAAIFEYNKNFSGGSPCVNGWTFNEMRAHEK